MSDEEALELDEEAALDEELLEQEAPPEPNNIAACPPLQPSADVTLAAVAPGVSAVAPSNWSSTGDQQFTLGVTGLSSFANDPIHGRVRLTPASAPTTKATCEATYVILNQWARSASSGCWYLHSGVTKWGVWNQDPIPFPTDNSTCDITGNAPNVSGATNTQVRLATHAFRRVGFPINADLPVNNLQAILVVDDN